MGAFLIWRALPLYLRPLHEVAPVTIMAHRLVWCCVFVSAWLGLRGELAGVGEALRHGPTRLRLMGSAVLISTNWLVYVWAVGSGHAVESSLGYFINPLVNVLLGVVLLEERLNRVQWTAVVCAAAGVVWLTVHAGRLPWIALVLALSFGGYGLCAIGPRTSSCLQSGRPCRPRSRTVPPPPGRFPGGLRTVPVAAGPRILLCRQPLARPRQPCNFAARIRPQIGRPKGTRGYWHPLDAKQSPPLHLGSGPLQSVAALHGRRHTAPLTL